MAEYRVIYCDKSTGVVVYDFTSTSPPELESKPAPKYGSKQFWKLYMKDFLKVLRAFNNKQLDVFAHILEKTQQSTNLFNGTYRSISKACNVSLSTVTEVMKLLQESGFIKKLQNGSYIVSPNVLVKCESIVEE